MDISTLLQAPIDRLVNGVTISFPRVPSRAVAKIVAAPKSAKREQALADATAAKLPPVDVYRAVQFATDRDFTTAEIIDYFDTPTGAEAVIRESLTRAKATAEEIEAVIDAMSFDDQTDLALRLTGVRGKQERTANRPQTNPDGSPRALGDPKANGGAAGEAKGFSDVSQTSSTGSAPAQSSNTGSDATLANSAST